MKLHPLNFALAGAITSALGMLLLSAANGLGLYNNAAMQMQMWHMYYQPNIGGTIAGMIEAAIISFVLLYVFAAIYNSLKAGKK